MLTFPVPPDHEKLSGVYTPSFNPVELLTCAVDLSDLLLILIQYPAGHYSHCFLRCFRFRYFQSLHFHFHSNPYFHFLYLHFQESVFRFHFQIRQDLKSRFHYRIHCRRFFSFPLNGRSVFWYPIYYIFVVWTTISIVLSSSSTGILNVYCSASRFSGRIQCASSFGASSILPR